MIWSSSVSHNIWLSVRSSFQRNRSIAIHLRKQHVSLWLTLNLDFCQSDIFNCLWTKIWIQNEIITIASAISVVSWPSNYSFATTIRTEKLPGIVKQKISVLFDCIYILLRCQWKFLLRKRSLGGIPP